MDCLLNFCCGCRTTSTDSDEAIKLTSRTMTATTTPRIPSNCLVTKVIEPTDSRLPKIHVNNVKESFATKLAQCRTTAVPSVGSYDFPFPAMKAVHLFQGTNESILSVVAFQFSPPHGSLCINLHHVLFPNYKERGDPGEKTVGFVNISDIMVNGESRPDIKQQKVFVHDGRFSPELELLAYSTELPVFLSAHVRLPKLRSEHLYGGIRQINMLNVVLPSSTMECITDTQSIENIADMLEDAAAQTIRDFIGHV